MSQIANNRSVISNTNLSQLTILFYGFFRPSFKLGGWFSILEGPRINVLSSNFQIIYIIYLKIKKIKIQEGTMAPQSCNSYVSVYIHSHIYVCIHTQTQVIYQCEAFDSEICFFAFFLKNQNREFHENL